MWLNARRVVSFVFVERNDYFSFTFYTKIQPKCPPFLKRLHSLLLFSLSRRTKDNTDLLSDKEDDALFQHPQVLVKVRLVASFSREITITIFVLLSIRGEIN